MNAPTPPQAGRSVVVGLFEREPQARQAVQGVRRLGLDERQVGILAPDQRSEDAPSAGASSDVSAVLAMAAVGNDVARVLVEMGVPEGEARFYASEAGGGRTLVVVDADGQYGAVRDLVLRNGGYDVQSRGAELARPAGAGVPGGSGAAPIDLTQKWEDVVSRYEMLWQQHYGTSDATWEQMAPVYRFAWQAANAPHYRGRPWAEVENTVRHEWESLALGSDSAASQTRESAAGRAPQSRREDAGTASARPPWSDVAGPIRDVWEDVADEATTGAEGGADRRIPSQGADQQVPAREVVPPSAADMPPRAQFP
jgi:hypothetical protein